MKVIFWNGYSWKIIYLKYDFNHAERFFFSVDIIPGKLALTKAMNQQMASCFSTYMTKNIVMCYFVI